MTSQQSKAAQIIALAQEIQGMPPAGGDVPTGMVRIDDLAGQAEIREYLGLPTAARFQNLVNGKRILFPPRMVILASGSLWDMTDIRAYARKYRDRVIGSPDAPAWKDA